jgi:hypothetical protein
MFGFIFTLLVVGGLGTIVAIGDPKNARLAPYIGFTALFAGIGALSLCLLLTLIGQQLLRSETLGGLGFFGGYVFGGLIGAPLVCIALVNDACALTLMCRNSAFSRSASNKCLERSVRCLVINSSL